MSHNLKQKTISGIAWSLMQTAGGRGINFLVTVVLARLLVPQDFGLIGMLTIFIALSQNLSNAGFSQALIQKKNANDIDFSTVFYINIALSFLLYCVLYFSAPLIASFYDQPLLINLVRVLCLNFVFNAFSFVQEIRLKKEMRFKKLAIAQVPSSIIAGLLSIVMAFNGYGVWSIVALQLVQRILFSIQIWSYVSWRPGFVFKFKNAKDLFSFGGNLLLARTVNTIYDNIYLLIIGKFFPLVTVGYFQHSNNMVNNTTQTFSQVLKNVTFSAFSSVQEDNARLKRGYSQIIQQVGFLFSPLFVLAAVMAEPAFELIFTEKWLPAVPYFQMLCVTGVLYPLNSFNLDMVNVKGRSDIYLKLGFVKKIITSVGILVAIPFGIWALLFMRVLDGVIGYLLNSHYAGSFINFKLRDQFKDLYPSLLLSSVVGILIFSIDSFLNTYSNIFRISVGILLGGGMYLTTAYLLNFTAFKEIKSILKLNKKKLRIINTK